MRNLKLVGLFISVSITFLLFSCSSTSQSKPLTLNFGDALNTSSDSFFQGEIEVESIIPLETFDSVLLTDIRKIIQADNLFFILDTDTKLWMFDIDGNFIREIGQEGQGPGEYPGLTDFAIDAGRREVYINSVQKIVVYDYDGSFKREVSLEDDNLQVLTYCNDKLFYIFPDKKYPDDTKSATLVSVLDLDGALLKEFPAHHLRRVGDIPFFNNIATDGKSVFYKEEIGQALYAIRNDFSVDTLCLLDFGRYAFQPDDFEFSKQEVWKERYRLQNILPADKFMLLIFQKGLKGQEFLPFIWCKEENKVSRFKYKVSYQGADLSVLPFAVSVNKVIGVLDAPEDGMETDNPVLVLLNIGK